MSLLRFLGVAFLVQCSAQLGFPAAQYYVNGPPGAMARPALGAFGSYPAFATRPMMSPVVHAPFGVPRVAPVGVAPVGVAPVGVAPVGVAPVEAAAKPADKPAAAKPAAAKPAAAKPAAAKPAAVKPAAVNPAAVKPAAPAKPAAAKPAAPAKPAEAAAEEDKPVYGHFEPKECCTETVTELLHYPDVWWNTTLKNWVETKPQTYFIPTDWKNAFEVPAYPGLEETKYEVEQIKRLKTLRPAYKDDIVEQYDDLFAIFTKVVKLPFMENEVIKAFLHGVLNDVTLVTLYFKRHFMRARPWQYDADIEPIIPRPGHPSYPSGHSTQGHCLAFAAGQLAPEYEVLFLAIANQVAVNREIGGVHYRSDTMAGIVLAEQVIAAMEDSQIFRQLRFKARQEMKKIIEDNKQ